MSTSLRDNKIIEAFQMSAATINDPGRELDFAPEDRNARGVAERWLWYLDTGNQEVSEDTEEIEQARQYLELVLETLQEPKPAPIVVDMPGPNNREGLPLVLWQMKAYLLNRELRPRRELGEYRHTQSAADLITDWIVELEKNS